MAHKFFIRQNGLVAPTPLGEGFITYWDTEQRTGWRNTNEVGSNVNTISLRLNQSYTYDCDIYWGDGAVSGLTNPVSLTIGHVYDVPGKYYITIIGRFGGFDFGATTLGDRMKILDVVQWDNVEFDSCFRMFQGCENLSVSAKDAPNLSGVTDMSYMFRAARLTNSNLNHWDVSNIINMEGLFEGMFGFSSRPLNNWDVSNVTNMSYMFGGIVGGPQNQYFNRFNNNIDNWDVTSVTNMTYMFSYNRFFNRDLSGWCVEHIPSKPTGFDENTDSWTLPKPDWGEPC